MNLRVWLAEVCDGVALKFVVIFVTDGHKVVPMPGELFHQVRPVGYACTEDDCLARATKDLMGFLDPGLDNIPGQLDAALCYFVG